MVIAYDAGTCLHAYGCCVWRVIAVETIFIRIRECGDEPIFTDRRDGSHHFVTAVEHVSG